MGGFAEQATDWRSLAAMMAGGMAYRAGRIGMMGLGNGSLLRVASVGAGLTAEVSTFEFSHRALNSLGGHSNGTTSNLWRWNGNGGIRQGLLQSFITFGALKGAGRLTQGENLIAQHLFQDTAMVFGHQVTGALGIAPRPEGSLAEQFLHAEATNLQIGAGMALAGRMAPGLQALERGLDLSLSGPDVGARSPRPQFGDNETGAETAPLQVGLHPALATAGRPVRETTARDLISLMANHGENGNGEKKSDPPVSGTVPSARGSSPPLPVPVYSSRFERCWEALDITKQGAVRRALQLLFDYYRTGVLPRGLDLKKLSGGRDDFYQMRISQKDRILFRKNNGSVEFLMIGGHNEVNQIVKKSEIGEDVTRRAGLQFDPLKVEEIEAAPTEVEVAPTEPVLESREEPAAEKPAPPQAPEGPPEPPSKEEAPQTSHWDELLSTPFPHHLEAPFFEVAALSDEVLRQSTQEMDQGPLLPTSRGVFQLLTFLRHVKGLLDPGTQGLIEILDEEILTQPGGAQDAENWAFEQYEVLRPMLISQIPVELAGAHPEIRSADPWLRGDEAAIALQDFLSRKNLPEDLRQTFARLAEEALQGEDPVSNYWRSSAGAFLENTARILSLPEAPRSDVRQMKARLERDFAELGVFETGLNPAFFPGREAFEGFKGEALDRIRDFWLRPESDLLLRAGKFQEELLRQRGQGEDIAHLLHRLSLLAAAGSRPEELAEFGCQQLLPLYQRDRRFFFHAILEAPEALDYVGRLPEISRIPLETASGPYPPKFDLQRAKAFEITARLSRIILAHTSLRPKLEEVLAKNTPENFGDPQAIEAVLNEVAKQVLNFYARHREELKTAPDRSPEYLKSLLNSLDRVDADLPWRFGEIHLLSDEAIEAKKRRFESYMKNPDAGESILRFFMPGGLNGELVFSSEGIREFHRDLRRDGVFRLPIPGSSTPIEITKETRVEITPVTPFFRLKIFLQTLLPPKHFRLLRLAVDLESPLQQALDRQLNQAAFLTLLGGPLEWVLHRLAQNVLQTYETGRVELLEFLQKGRPGLFADAVAHLPDARLIDVETFFRLLSDPHWPWPNVLREKIRLLQEELNRNRKTIWTNPGELALGLASGLARFYLYNRQEILRALGITEDLKEILTRFEETFSDERMPELYQIPNQAYGPMQRIFRQNLSTYNPNLHLHEVHLRIYLICNWPTLPSRMKEDYLKALGPSGEREKFPFRTMVRTLKFYEENRKKILQHLPLLN